MHKHMDNALMPREYHYITIQHLIILMSGYQGGGYPPDDPYGYDDEEWDEYEREYERMLQAQQQKKPKTHIGSVIALVAVIIIIILLLPKVDQFLANPTMSYREYPETADFEVQRVVTIQGFDYDFWVEMPVAQDIEATYTSFQKVEQREHEETPGTQFVTYTKEYKIITQSEDGTPISLDASRDCMNWSGENVMGNTEIVLRYKVTTTTSHWEIDEKNSGTVDAIPIRYKDLYNHDEWKIRPSDPTIDQLARQLTIDKYTVYEKARAIYDYIRENIEYRTRDPEPKDCMETLNSKWGDCDDQSILFCSLCRAVGIPAWLGLGVLYDDDTNSWGGHAWVNLIMPKTTGAVGEVSIDVVNNEFLMRSCYKFEEYESNGNATHLFQYYHPNRVVYNPQNPVSIDTEWVGLYFHPSQETVKIGADGQNPVPGPDMFMVTSSFVLVALYIGKKRKYK